MRKQIVIPFAVWICCSAIVRGQETELEKGADTIFGLHRVVDVHLNVAPEEWAKMQPPADVAVDFFSIMQAFDEVAADAEKGGHFRSDKSSRAGLAGYLGIDHQYGSADVTIDDESVPGVGLRYKGNGTFLEGHGRGKLSFKIDFNRFNEESEFRGLTKLNLNSCITDPTFLREALSYELFRAAGIPCSRVGFAHVAITIPGHRARESLGLYTIIEQVDKRFLRDRFGSSDGLLLKPSTFGVFRYLGEAWSEYEIGFVPKTTPTPAQQNAVIEFAKLVHLADDDEFDRRVADYLDVDQFLRFMAVNVLLSNLDSFLAGAQNYYVYFDPTSRRFQFLPWDMDHSFGNFPLTGTPETRRDLSIHVPGGERHTFIRRILELPRYRDAYDTHLANFLATIFSLEAMHPLITETHQHVMGIRNSKQINERFEGVQQLHWFVEGRRESVQKQLDGESQGSLVHIEMERFPFRRIVIFAVAMLLLILINGIGWIWNVVAGFRGSKTWGFLNMCFYPVTPTIYGLAVRRDLGFRSALLAIVGVIGFVVWFMAAAATFG